MQFKNTLFNDPIYGFITIETELILQLINHRYFQRLRRIFQMGLSNLVYPGAHHTRFEHAIGAMHVMQMAIRSIKQKGINISDEENEAMPESGRADAVCRVGSIDGERIFAG